MSVVKINAIEVPAERSGDFEQRFAERAKTVETMPGFEGFELLRPIAGDTRYFVYTRWTDDESFQKWVGSDEFRRATPKVTARRVSRSRPMRRSCSSKSCCR